MFSDKLKLKITKTFLWIASILSFFWWPLSHWVYPAWYHRILGFDGFEDMYVKVIGTLALIPVLIMFFCAINPIKNRDGIKILILSGIAMTFTYIYLIQKGLFPTLEYINAGITLFLSLFLLIFYPWRIKTRKDNV